MKGRDIKLLKTDRPGKFRTLHNVLDFEMKKRAKEGLGSTVKKASVVERENEEELWRSEVLNTETGPGLLNAIFYKVGLHFALRGGAEHYELKATNFQIVTLSGNIKALQYRNVLSDAL